MTDTSRLAPHTEAISDRRLLLSWCGACSALDFPPRALCIACGDAGDPQWNEATGNGTVWSYSTFHKRYNKGFPLDVPYTVAVIELDEGAKVYANVLDSHMTELHIGMAVRAEYVELSPGRTGLTFTPRNKDL